MARRSTPHKKKTATRSSAKKSKATKKNSAGKKKTAKKKRTPKPYPTLKDAITPEDLKGGRAIMNRNKKRYTALNETYCMDEQRGVVRAIADLPRFHK